MWCVILTMSTSIEFILVGYGELVPGTSLGRLVAFLAGIMGALLGALFVVSI